MSRSRRHTPIGATAGSRHSSEKWDKKMWHRNYRSLTKRLAREGNDEHPAFDRHGRNLVSNPWGMSKDGKSWLPHRYWAFGPAMMRK
jgi:hypothetical protein